MSNLMNKFNHRLRYFLSGLRAAKLRLQGFDIGKSLLIEPGVQLVSGYSNSEFGSIKVGQHVHLSKGAVLNAWGGEIDLADWVFVGPYSVIYGHGGVTIGSHTLIAMHCAIVAAEHFVPETGELIGLQADRRLPVTIGSDVWLGAGVKVLAGVTIGDGCVVGAGAVVTKDLPENSIAMGVPAKVVGVREKQK